ncbi:hypothetical protein PGB90_005088 [Kerria lacca]
MKIPFEHTSVVGNQIFNIIIHPRIDRFYTYRLEPEHRSMYSISYGNEFRRFMITWKNDDFTIDRKR